MAAVVRCGYVGALRLDSDLLRESRSFRHSRQGF
jgi:hypothetical protein